MAFINFLKAIIQIVVGVCITTCCLPVILPLFIFFYILSTFVRLLIKIKYKDKATVANGIDVLYGTVGSKSYTVVNIAIRFVGQMDVPKFKSRVLHVLQNSVNQKGQRRYRRLTQTYGQEYGYALWKDCEDFNIEQHISVINLEELLKKNIEIETRNQNGPVNYKHVEKLQQLLKCRKDIDWKILMKIILNELGYKTISPEIPQWQVLFIEESADRYTLLFRFNHAVADGVYMTRMLCEDFLESPVELFHKYNPPSRFKSFLLGLWSYSLIPFGLWKISKNKDKNVLHGPKLSGKKRFFMSNLVELENLKSIKTRIQIGAYNIIFSCLSNALASHFERRSTIVKDVTTMIPIPRQDLRKSLRCQNKFALVSIKIPTPPNNKTSFKGSNNEACNSFGRLHMTKSVLEGAKEDPSFIAAYIIITTACSILPAGLSEFLLSPKGITINFSNFPGPRTEIYYGTDRIEDIMFWNPDHDPMGVGISLLSYVDKIRVGLYIDEALLVDETEGDLLLQDFIDEFKNILQEVDKQEGIVDYSIVESSKF